ncbi:MAG TPA: OmpA family protein [Chryseolinea sp.]|nr:OmpA family protein [Chryseolinea sp.]
MRVFLTVGLLLFFQPLFAQRPVSNAFGKVNSAYDELDPVVSPDGRTLFVTLANHPSNIGGKKDQGDIWISTMGEDNQWSAPVHGGNLINDGAFNAVAGVSSDGTQLFLLGHYSTGGPIRTQGIAVSNRAGDGWSRPENISIPYFQNKASVLTGHVTASRSVFVFSAETYGTRGVEDIYVSLRTSDGKWSEAKNLGGVINTPFQELSPSLSADGKTLYFSSNGRKGYGSFDVYSSVRLDDTWTNWSVPVNLGAAYNTEGREMFFRSNEMLGFMVYASTKNSDGYGDIRISVLDEPYKPDKADSVIYVEMPPVMAQDTVSRVVEIARAPADGKNVRVHGKITNAKTGEAIVANLYFAAPANSQTTQATADGYVVTIPSTDDYSVRIEGKGYVSTMEKLELHTYELNDLEMNFRLQPIEVGTTVNLKDVLFEQGKTVLLPQSYPELDLVVSFLKANPNVKIELAGHTDNRGIPAQNVKLSQARTEKVKEYLVSKGVEGKRVSGKGYGGAKPIASNDDEETRKLNRRVEFVIKKS